MWYFIDSTEYLRGESGLEDERALFEMRMRRNFPFPEYRPGQSEGLHYIAYEERSLHEAHSGFGKSRAWGFPFLKACIEEGNVPVLYTTPTKTLVRDLARHFPGAVEAYGRNENRCLYYKDEFVTAEESPCYYWRKLNKCAHAVDLETGKTLVPGAEPCPYLWRKYLVSKGELIVCTHSFFIANMLFDKKFRENPPYAVVIDEVHRVPEETRNILRFTITDSTLQEGVEGLSKIHLEADLKEAFEVMDSMARLKPFKPVELLSEHENKELFSLFNRLKEKGLDKSITAALASGVFDPVKDRKTIKTLENLARDIPWWATELSYAIEAENRKPENYCYMWYRKEKTARQKVTWALNICHYYVNPVIKFRILKGIKRIVAYSATIGDPNVFAIESGMDYPFHTYPPIFPVENTRIFLPTDAPNLSYRNQAQNPGNLEKAMLMIAEGCESFLEKGYRSLVGVVSEEERQKFLEMFSNKFQIVTYGDEIRAKEAAEEFIKGRGEILLGTVANYSEGIDLPYPTAPAIFVLRPDFPKPMDPQAQFERRRWKEDYYKLWLWRVSIRALQIRGRNIRSEKDRGVAFFISQQFEDCFKKHFPEWLKPALRKKPYKECIMEGLEVVEKGKG
jgi:Rad3-related DNA helicase